MMLKDDGYQVSASCTDKNKIKKPFSISAFIRIIASNFETTLSIVNE